MSDASRGAHEGTYLKKKSSVVPAKNKKNIFFPREKNFQKIIFEKQR